MPDTQPIQSNGPGATCIAGTPIYNNSSDLDYIDNYHHYLQREIDKIQNNINELKRILSNFVCALASRPALKSNPQFVNYANAAILRLAQTYKTRGDKEKAAGRTDDAQADYQTALSYINAFYQANGVINFAVTQGTSPNATEASILQLARILPQTYAHGLSQTDAQAIKNDLAFALASDSVKAQLGDHLFSEHLTLTGNVYTCSCDNPSHIYSWDVSIEARLLWAANAAPAQVIGRINALLDMVKALPSSNAQRGQIYVRALSAIARAYAARGKSIIGSANNQSAINDCQLADNIFRALLDRQVPIPSPLNIDQLTPSLDANDTSKIKEEYYWNLVNLRYAEGDAPNLQSIAIDIHDHYLNQGNYNKILGAALGNIWMLELDAHLKNKTDIPDSQIGYLNLILRYLGDENIIYTLTPTTNSSELLKTAIWALIDCERKYDTALTLAVKHRFTDITIVALDNKIKAVGEDRPASLLYRIACALMQKHVLDSIPIDGQYIQVWEAFKRIAQSQLGLNPDDFSRDPQKVEVRRGDLYNDLKMISEILRGIDLNRITADDPLRPILQILNQSQVTADKILNLAMAENNRIETEKLEKIRTSADPTLDDFLALAQAYTEMANYHNDSGNLDFAQVCLRRAEAIYRIIVIGSGNSPAIRPLGPNRDYLGHKPFEVEQLELQDINDIIQILSGKHYNSLSNVQRMEVYLGFANATRRADLRSDLDPATGQPLLDLATGQPILDEVLLYYNKVRELYSSQILPSHLPAEVKTNCDKLDKQAQNGIRDARRTWTEILIQNGRAEEAIQKLQGYINGLTPAAEGEARTEDLKFYLLCLTDLAWAYEKWAEKLKETPGHREQIEHLYLQSAAIYRLLTLGEISAEADPALSSILNKVKTTGSLTADMTTAAILSEANTSTDKLYLKYLDYLRLAGTEGPLGSASCEDLLTQVINKLQDPRSSVRDNILLSSALTALHQRQVARGDTENARKSIEQAVTAGEAAYNAGHNEHSFSVLTLALGVRGGFLSAASDRPGAYADFMRAAELYRTEIAGRQQDKFSLHLDRANLLKAASQNAPTDQEAEALLNQAAEEFSRDQGPAARAGLAEIYILQGNLLEKSRQNVQAEAKYREALRLCLTVLSSSPSPENLKASAAILQNILTLSRAADNLYQLLVEGQENYILLKLALLRELLGLPQGILPQIQGADIEHIILSIRGVHSQLTDPDVLAEAQQSIWNIRYQYLESLRVTHNYSLALSAARDYLNQVPATPSLEEMRFKLKVLKLIADINCYNLEPHNLEPAQANYEQVVTLANAFGTQDPEIASLVRNAHQRLAYIHQTNGDFEQAITELKVVLSLVGEHITPEGAVAAAQIYLILARIYADDLKEADLARENLIAAQAMFLVPGVNQNEVLNLQAQTYNALGEIARLIDKDYPVAAAQYQAALTLFTASNDQNMITQIHAALAFLRTAEHNYQEAESELSLAQANLEGATEGVTDMVDDATTALRKEELKNTAYVQFGAALHGNTFEGNPQPPSYPISLQLGAPVWNNLRLDLGYSYGPDHSTTYYNSASLERLPRMSSTGHHLDFGATYEDEYGNWQYKVNPYVAFDIYDYTINGYVHPADYTTIIDSYTEDGNYLAATQGFNSELFYKLLPKLQLGLGFGLSVTERSGTIPSQAAEEQTSKEFPNVEPPQLESDPFLSWYLHPQVRWNNFSLGFRAGNSAYDVTEHGFWPLEGRDTMRYAATLGYNNLFTWGDNDKWFVKLDLGSEIGTHLFLNGSEGIGYEVSDNFIPQLIFSESYFNDFSMNTSSYSFGLGLRINFDLTPSSDQ